MFLILSWVFNPKNITIKYGIETQTRHLLSLALTIENNPNPTIVVFHLRFEEVDISLISFEGGKNVEDTGQFSLRAFIQKLMEECRDEFDQESNPEERIRIVCSKSESLKVSDVVHREDAWPRKNEELSKRNREDGNQAESRTRF